MRWPFWLTAGSARPAGRRPPLTRCQERVTAIRPAPAGLSGSRPRGRGPDRNPQGSDRTPDPNDGNSLSLWLPRTRGLTARAPSPVADQRQPSRNARRPGGVDRPAGHEVKSLVIRGPHPSLAVRLSKKATLLSAQVRLRERRGPFCAHTEEMADATDAFRLPSPEMRWAAQAGRRIPTRSVSRIEAQ